MARIVRTATAIMVMLAASAVFFTNFKDQRGLAADDARVSRRLEQFPTTPRGALSTPTGLVAAGPGPEQETIALSEQLFTYIDSRNVPAVESLFSRGASTDVYSPVGSTPLIEAIRRRDPTILDVLLAHGVNTNLPALPSGQTPLQLALQLGDLALAQRLLNAGADINQKDAAGDNALLFVIKQRPINYSAVELLLSQTPTVTTSAPNLMATDAQGMTAGEVAQQSGDPQLIALFQRYGAGVYIPMTEPMVEPMPLQISTTP